MPSNTTVLCFILLNSCALCVLFNSKKNDVFDKEQKELDEVDELDKFILNHLCSDIMEEVMDMGSDFDKFVAATHKKSSRKNKKNKKSSS